MTNRIKKSILLTGGAGYIGSHAVDALIKANYRVTIIDDLSTGFKELLHPEASFYKLSIHDTKSVTEIMKNENIEGVIHFAAKIIVPESITNPLSYYENNTQGVVSILKACKNNNINKFVFSSTAAVYGNASSDFVTESTLAAPINPYGFSKLFSEQIIKDTELEFGLKNVIFRYFNVAGASLSGNYGQRSKSATHLIKLASEAACKKRSSINITGTDYPTPDGTGIRDYIHVEDLASAHVLAMDYLQSNGESQLFNCGYGRGYSVREVIECMKKISKVNFDSFDVARRPGDVAKLISDSSKLKSILNWKPKNDDLEIICQSAYDFEKQLD